ncbi:MAG: hypothetical protein FJX72_19120 [Armatimonadetes bacterium]|nr:hypothetical protein [Armatimonadota bacterium]
MEYRDIVHRADEGGYLAELGVAADHRLPTWARRVPQALIRRFYETDARGIYDEDPINEAGYALLARCESFITACRAVQGELPCPACEAPVRRDVVLRCRCGWELPWKDYFETIQHKQLSGAEPVIEQFRHFVNTFPASRTLRERVLLIDRLLHGFHWFLRTDRPTRPVAVNLIEGNLREVVQFLDQLSAGQAATDGLAEARAEWERNIAMNADWYKLAGKGDPPESA